MKRKKIYPECYGPSKFEFRDIEEGVLVLDHSRKTQCEVKLAPSKLCFTIKQTVQEYKTNKYADKKVEIVEGLYSVHKIVTRVADELRYEFNKTLERKIGYKGSFKDNKIKEWATGRTGKAIAKKLAEKLRKLREQADPTALFVQRKVFSILGPKRFEKCCNQFNHVDFYKSHELWIKDLRNYNGAVCIFVDSGFKHDEWMKSFVRQKEYDCGWIGFSKREQPKEKPLYKALTKTLMTIQGSLLMSLCESGYNVKLGRPIVHPLEQKIFAYTMGRHNFDLHQPCLERSTIPQFKKAIRDVCVHLHLKCDLRKRDIIKQCINFILDYPEQTNCDVTGLAQRSLAWHRDAEARKIKESAERLLVKTKLPPIDLPKNPKITFLDTIGAVQEEGVKMGHCISSYGRYAENGQCYLFHIEHDGEHASAEVKSNGVLAQCHGPHNRDNKAVSYGKSQLAKWCILLKIYLKDKDSQPKIDKTSTLLPTLTAFTNNLVAVGAYDDDEVPF